MTTLFNQAEFDHFWRQGFKYSFHRLDSNGAKEIPPLEFFQLLTISLPDLESIYLKNVMREEAEFLHRKIESATSSHVHNWIVHNSYPHIYESQVVCDETNNSPENVTPHVTIRLRPARRLNWYTMDYWLGE